LADKRELTVIGHLDELRKRIIICLLAVALGGCISFPFGNQILKVLRLPVSNYIKELAFFSPQEAFMVYVKVAVVSGLIISMPIILLQVWAFISPAIEERFRRYSVIFILFSLVAFALGGLFAYFLLLPAALKFLLSFGQGQLIPVISVSKYISFSLAIVLGTGLVFEMPVLSFILSKIGILNHLFLRKRFKYAILAIFITAAIITPTPDIFNMMLLAVPMLVLYEMSIWVSFFVGPKAEKPYAKS